jgi:hypothetical protein
LYIEKCLIYYTIIYISKPLNHYLLFKYYTTKWLKF